MCKMALSTINTDYSIIISQDEITYIDASMDKMSETAQYGYEDLLKYYGTKEYKREGTKLKSLLSGKYTPTKLGLKTINRNSKVDEVITLYRNRCQYTIDLLVRNKKEYIDKSLSMRGIYGVGRKWFITLTHNKYDISIGPLKSSNHASTITDNIDDYIAGKVPSIQKTRLILNTTNIHPMILCLLDTIYPDRCTEGELLDMSF